MPEDSFTKDVTRRTESKFSCGLFIAASIAVTSTHIGDTDSFVSLMPKAISEAENNLINKNSSINDTLPWLSKIYNTGHDLKTGDDVFPIMAEISELFQGEQLQRIDLIMKDLDVDRLSPVGMIAFMRSTCSSKSQLPHWYEALNKVKNQMIKMGLNTDRTLRGLI